MGAAASSASASAVPASSLFHRLLTGLLTGRVQNGVRVRNWAFVVKAFGPSSFGAVFPAVFPAASLPPPGRAGVPPSGA